MSKFIKAIMCGLLSLLTVVGMTNCSSQNEEETYIGSKFEDNIGEENATEVFPSDTPRLTLPEFKDEVMGRLWVVEDIDYHAHTVDGKEIVQDDPWLIGGWYKYFSAFEANDSDVLLFLRDIGQPGGPNLNVLGVVQIHTAYSYNAKTGLLTIPLLWNPGSHHHSIYLESVKDGRLVTRDYIGHMRFLEVDGLMDTQDADPHSYRRVVYRLGDEKDRERLDKDYPPYSGK